MERDVGKFLAALASAAPAPGGGGAAALCGALAIALGNMVGNLTLGKKKYAGVQDYITALNARAESLRLDFLALIDADAAAFDVTGALTVGCVLNATGAPACSGSTVTAAKAIAIRPYRTVLRALRSGSIPACSFA